MCERGGADGGEHTQQGAVRVRRNSIEINPGRELERERAREHLSLSRIRRYTVCGSAGRERQRESEVRESAARASAKRRSSTPSSTGSSRPCRRHIGCFGLLCVEQNQNKGKSSDPRGKTHTSGGFVAYVIAAFLPQQQQHRSTDFDGGTLHQNSKNRLPFFCWFRLLRVEPVESLRKKERMI